MKRYKFNVEITLDTDKNVNNDLTDEELNNSFIEGFKELLNDEVGYICKVNVKEDLKWQKLKEFIKTNIENDEQEYDESQMPMFAHYLSVERFIINKMEELEGEDDL